jgi:hypothetical protein
VKSLRGLCLSIVLPSSTGNAVLPAPLYQSELYGRIAHHETSLHWPDDVELSDSVKDLVGKACATYVGDDLMSLLGLRVDKLAVALSAKWTAGGPVADPRSSYCSS